MKNSIVHKTINLLLISTFLLLINSCAYFRLKELDKYNFSQDNIYDLVSKEYKEFAYSELYEMHDELDANYFAFKANNILKTKIIRIENPKNWKIPNNYENEAKEEYKKISSLLKEEFTFQYPKLVAKLVSGYDCWLEQIEENWQIDHINLCFTNLKDNLDFISTSQSNILKNLSDGSKKENNIQDRVLQENINNDKDNGISKDESQTSDSIYINNATVFFEFDKFNLTSSQIIELELFVKRAIINPDMKIFVEGHTDTVGSSNYNYSLSKKRANFIKEYLLKRNLKNNIQIKAYGESRLLMITEDEVKEKKNRRAELYLK